jgi:hypothetical protein
MGLWFVARLVYLGKRTSYGCQVCGCERAGSNSVHMSSCNYHLQKMRIKVVHAHDVCALREGVISDERKRALRVVKRARGFMAWIEHPSTIGGTCTAGDGAGEVWR